MSLACGGDMESMESPELPECPVCLQNYDSESTIPRVLACGHSACEACLVRLPERYPETIRCPACTQLVKYPPQGPTALPKNIDLLSFSLSLHPNPNSGISQTPHKQSADGVGSFLPCIWSDEFYIKWKDWVLPSDAVSVETEVDDGTRDELCTVLKGRTGSGFGSGRVWFREDESVSLFRVGSLPGSDSSGFEFSYTARVLKCLSGMREEERNEMGLLLRVSLRHCRRVCKVYGFWGNLEDGFLYLGCERRNRSFSGKLGAGEDGFTKDGLPAFAMIAMEVCEVVSGLNSEGFVAGCFGFSCFSFDDFGHVEVDLNEVIVTGRKVWRSVVDSVSGGIGTESTDAEVLKLAFWNLFKDGDFVSPEVLIELLQKQGFAVECDSSRYPVGCGSDVWSLACVFLRLLLGKEFDEELVKNCGISFFDHVTYASWIERVRALIEGRLGQEYASLRENLCKCLNYDPASRPLVMDLMKCIRELIIKPQCDIMASLEGVIKEDGRSFCLILGQLCGTSKEILETPKENGLQGSEISGGSDFDQVGDERADSDFVDGLAGGKVKFKILQGHRDAITALAVGGDFLFSSSFDKTIHVWSLQDFSHVHTFKGHEHTIKALIYVDEEQPLCISGDSGGGIFVWGTCTPLRQEPLKTFHEDKDWRFSGIHALACRNGYVYTGSGDRTVKACGSWDGTIRLWSLSDHSPLTVLGEDTSGTVASVLSLAVDRHMLIATHDNGCVKVWRNDVFMKSIKMHNGAVFASGIEGKWLFTGGLDKTVNVQELSGDEFQIDSRLIGSIPCDSVITTLLGWQGKIFVGCANRNIVVSYYGK
ncbi:uncharacterized protein LOC126603331 isoform X2 [Malus sylvestris]|uniref:uncharacterized protein LOC126603331 isoform X2 n=1 Tax=Malus sylvestris TaxID=3752 RepID=UPI0021AC8BD5|nr:uncharacterized protein LOC126603331 isoform X2 [Malus sylvestris]